jgi:hypothetical protein
MKATKPEKSDHPKRQKESERDFEEKEAKLTKVSFTPSFPSLSPVKLHPTPVSSLAWSPARLHRNKSAIC